MPRRRRGPVRCMHSGTERPATASVCPNLKRVGRVGATRRLAQTMVRFAGGDRPRAALPVRRRPMELSLATRTVAEHTVLEVGGEVDVYTAPRLRERLVELVDGGARDVVVDLSRVDFLDSTGLGVLVGALKRLRSAGG